ncbi:hypothetical protein A2982_00535 [candidate division WWE3 bacterium RIFCSPLOWO2_01_FULL_39_13]|uniref:Uncharacterized protein n=1 Tax=candidate division WWE3 bacterium RIFCSPLOWO2_01_FULL_39_13 TaxID=1802624 RepID=A0A1F4V3H3_UNCKA|nr:MAG: hypothetical protein A2982_00535 [candidate division WWE3 bacterium RIFCSPLOWO2_01_FULL_39_13]
MAETALPISLSEKALREFSELYGKVFGKTLDIGQTKEQGEELINFVYLVLNRKDKTIQDEKKKPGSQTT